MSALGAIQDLLQHIWDLASGPGPTAERGPADRELRRLTHATIKGSTHDLEGFRFNTLISKLMILRNELRRLQGAQGESEGAGRAAWFEAIDALIKLAAPAFPHLAEELWTAVRGHPYSVHQQAWPTWDEALLAEDELTLVVQINGKVRDQLRVPAAIGRDEAQLRERALQLPRLQPYLAGGGVQRVVVVPGKLLNIVVRA
jgi:leucyl-tRNA synthetase